MSRSCSYHLAATLVAAHVASIVVAQDVPPPEPDVFATPCVLDLGDGLSVRRDRPFWAWEPVGFSFGQERNLWRATTFARAPSGRIVALAPRFPMQAGAAPESQWEVLYTDDLGSTWSRSRWPDPGSFRATVTGRRPWGLRRECAGAALVAFDPGSTNGVAVTRWGRVLSTEDEGARWRVRRTGQRFVHAWVRGRSVLLLDADGAIWRSGDLGSTVRSLAAPGARIELQGELLVVIADGRPRHRLDSRGVLTAY